MKNIIRSKNTYLTIAFFAGLVFSVLFIPSLSDSSSALSLIKSFAFPNYILLACPVILTAFLSGKTTEKESFVLLSLTYTVLLIIFCTEFVKANATLFFAAIAILLLSVICINVGQPFASFVLIPGLFLRSLGTGYIFIVYIPVLLLLLMKLSQTEKEEKKSMVFTVGAYLYAVIFAVILFARCNLTISIYPAEFNRSPVEAAKLVAGCLLVLTASAMFIIRALPMIKKGGLLLRLSAVLFALFPLAGCVIALLTGVISSSFTTVFLVTMLIYIVGNTGISLQDKSAPPVLPEKYGHIILGLCGAAMCILVF